MLALGASALPAQESTTFSAEVKVVNLLATVRNKKGEIVRTLTRDDFSIEEEERPQTLRYFSRESDLPLTLGLLVDTSGSQRRVLGAERSASYRFFEQVLREDKDLAFVIHFDREAELLEDLTSSRKKLEQALELLESPQMGRRGGGWGGGPHGGQGGGGTGGRGRPAGTVLYDAAALASDELMRKQSGRKALIVLSDGVDNGSKFSITTAIESAQRADTLIYGILFADPEAYGRGMGGYGGHGGHGRRGPMPASARRPDGKKVLEGMASETGGGFFEVSHKLTIEQVYDRIQEELRNQYSLGYVPDRKSPGYHKIRVLTRDRSLIVRTRAGYYGEG